MKINSEELLSILNFLEDYISERKFKEEGQLREDLIHSETIFPVLKIILQVIGEYGKFLKVFMSVE